jgi:hypothetical protein
MLTVQLVDRAPTARLDPKHPEPLALEVGFPIDTAPRAATPDGDRKERGLMVAVLLANLDQLPQALHIAADLWHMQLTRDPALKAHAGTDQLPVQFSLPSCFGVVTMRPDELSTDLHKLADVLMRKAAIAPHLASLHPVAPQTVN